MRQFLILDLYSIWPWFMLVFQRPRVVFWWFTGEFFVCFLKSFFPAFSIGIVLFLAVMLLDNRGIGSGSPRQYRSRRENVRKSQHFLDRDEKYKPVFQRTNLWPLPWSQRFVRWKTGSTYRITLNIYNIVSI